MSVKRHILCALATVSAVALLSLTVEAHPRCGFDRYGYHPPDFRGCPDFIDERPLPPRAPPPRRAVKRPPPADGYYADGYYYAAGIPPGPGCYYDNGYNMRVHRVCYGGW